MRTLEEIYSSNVKHYAEGTMSLRQMHEDFIDAGQHMAESSPGNESPDDIKELPFLSFMLSGMKYTLALLEDSEEKEQFNKHYVVSVLMAEAVDSNYVLKADEHWKAIVDCANKFKEEHAM